ncbi:MAG: lytic murein transglycosylase [bacterium]|nr:lytic murein transglycosylase [bacterium]
MFRKIFIVFVFITIVCGGIFAAPALRAQELTPEERASLERQYDELQREIAVQEQIIKDTQAKKNTLQGDVTTLNAQIKAAQAQINAKNITIKQLSSQIVKKNVVIGQLSDRIERGKESLAAILRQTQMLDDYSVVSVALSAQSVSEFFSDLDAFTSIKTDLQSLFADIRDAKAQTESEKADLAVKKDQTADAKYEVEVQQKQITNNKIQKQQLLTITANQEAEYKKVLVERQAKAAAIRAALFPLRDAGAITFGNALAYAKEAQTKTGVRPALILAVLTQESNLGANVGQCYLTNDSTGAGVGKNTGTPFAKVMSPTRDVPPFLALSNQLGFNPHQQVVSCPIKSAGGWGGAMGPAQFIASTWALYASRVASARGVAIANPWDPQDAITAMSIYLGGLGAGAGGYTAERTAAAKYYAGGAWATAGRGYANSVMALAESLQSNIDFLANN